MESIPDEMLHAMEQAKKQIYDDLGDTFHRFVRANTRDYNKGAKEDPDENKRFWFTGMPKEHNVFGEGINYKKFPKSGFLPFLDFCKSESCIETLNFYQRILDLERLAEAGDCSKYLVLFGRVYVKYIPFDSEFYTTLPGAKQEALTQCYEDYKADILQEEIIRGFAPNDLVGALGVAKFDQKFLLRSNFTGFKKGKGSKKDYKDGPEGKRDDFAFWVNGEPKEYNESGAGKTYKKFPKSGYKKFLKYCNGKSTELAKAIEFHQRALELASLEHDREKYLTLVGASEYEGILSGKVKKMSDLSLPANAKKKLAKAIKKYSDEIAPLFSE